MAVDDLLLYVLGDLTHPLAPPLKRWMEQAPRFRTFVDTYRDKIRKKARTARDEASSHDLLCELQVAYRLLLERRFAVEYERYGLGKRRSPDLTVTYKTHTPFNVEVRRLRLSSREPAEQAEYRLNRLSNAVCDKLPQMPVAAVNGLVLVSATPYASDDLAQVMKTLKARADGKDEGFFQGHGYAGAREFLLYYLRLGAIVACAEPVRDGWASVATWQNREARPALPADILRLAVRALTGAEDRVRQV